MPECLRKNVSDLNATEKVRIPKDKNTTMAVLRRILNSFLLTTKGQNNKWFVMVLLDEIFTSG